ncbi:hypothetical protein F5883DRAFT_140185 [Diaporthe sp. PMI_573]|nr:hypothetical protein F5883DRAFT_140185 [Diaporthaceae sp. PMI_573]
MSDQATETEALVARLSHQPETLIQAMITISDPPGPLVTLQIQDRQSSLGALDGLPPELVHEVLDHLDVRSLTRFSQTCCQAQRVVGSLSSYRNLLSHAPDALAALSGIKAIHLHSISQLHAVLRSPRCETCPEYGAFLFLPTCDRACWQCLQFRKERLVVPIGVARKALALTDDPEKFHMMTSIPGRYGIRQLEYGYGPLSVPSILVAVAHAMELAISKHGSVERLRESLSQQAITGPGAHSAKKLRDLLWFDGYFDANLVPDVGSSLVGRYFGRASIRFPSLMGSDKIEYGHWCRGCQWMDDQRHRLPADVLVQIVPADVDPDRELLRMARIAYSTAGFLEHIQHCYGAQRLKSEPDEEQ